MDSIEWSDDGRYMGYMFTTNGSDWSRAKIRDSLTMKDLDDEINWIKLSGLSWTNDNKGFFYSRFDAPKDQVNAGMETEENSFHKVYYHRLNTKQE